MPDDQSLRLRLVRRGLIGLLILAALLFISAGSLRYWQGWAFMVLNLAFSLSLVIYFYKRDPELLERRLLRKEKASEQKLIMTLGRLASVPAYLLPGLDYRFGWSRTLVEPVPLWLTLLALLVILDCHLLFFWVMSVNRFAASIIQVEAGQTVAATGPYRLVRHPMYLGIVVSQFATPLALGSFIALPAFVLLTPIIVLRLLSEEKILCRELPGYSEYCQHTRRRLIPFVW